MATPTTSDVARAAWPAVTQFDLALRAAVTQQVPAATGTVFCTPAAPAMWDLNFLHVTRHGVSADELEADAATALAGLPHRMLILDEPLGGLTLAGTMSSRGWTVERHLAMVAGPVPSERAVRGVVRELPPPQIAVARRDALAAEGFDAETIAMIESVDQAVGLIARERTFASPLPGGVGAFAKLYSDGTVGQIEDVATLAPHRNEGRAQDVVLSALEASRAAGHTVTFLWADEAATAKDLYGKLGFTVAGVRWRVRRTVPAGPA